MIECGVAWAALAGEFYSPESEKRRATTIHLVRRPANGRLFQSPMKYKPQIKSMKSVCGAPLAPGYTAMLFDNIESAGAIQYAFLVGVFDDTSKQPVYFIASEVNTMAGTLGGGSHFLGVFDGEGHVNLGSSDDWGDPKKFLLKALEMVEARFSADRKA